MSQPYPLLEAPSTFLLTHLRWLLDGQHQPKYLHELTRVHRLPKSMQDDERGINPPSTAYDSEMLQVQDMEFGLVRPNIAHFQVARTSKDSNMLGAQ